MGEVVYTDGDVMLNERGQNDDCIETLERLLQKAKDGEIVGVAASAQYADRSVSESVGGFIWNSPCIGSLMCMVARFTN